MMTREMFYKMVKQLSLEKTQKFYILTASRIYCCLNKNEFWILRDPLLLHLREKDGKAHTVIDLEQVESVSVALADYG